MLCCLPTFRSLPTGQSNIILSTSGQTSFRKIPNSIFNTLRWASEFSPEHSGSQSFSSQAEILLLTRTVQWQQHHLGHFLQTEVHKGPHLHAVH